MAMKKAAPKKDNDLAGSPAAGKFSKSGAKVYGAPGRTDQRKTDQAKRASKKAASASANAKKVAKGKK